MKVRIYRILGWLFLILGVLFNLVGICQPSKFQQFIANPLAEFIPSVFGILSSIAFNIFIWTGVVCLRQADINEGKNKPKWSKIIKTYAILTAVIVLILVSAILIPNLLRR